MKIGIMQPYFIPYIGYFQLIKAVDKFVFYDDVNYIKGGWVNRNRILLNRKEYLLTVPLIDASSFSLISEVGIATSHKTFKNLLKTIHQAYHKAPFFSQVFPLLELPLLKNENTIAKLDIEIVINISRYLRIETQFIISSEKYQSTIGLEKNERIFEICRLEECFDYINAIGGQELYSKDFFHNNGFNLFFLKTNSISYKQFGNDFIPWLSIVDALMFNSPEEVNFMLDQFELI